MNDIILENKKMKLHMDRTTGCLKSMKLPDDQIQTEFLGNKENTSYTSIQEMNQWMGDIKLRVWDEKKHIWTEELTSLSNDVRQIAVDENTVCVSYNKSSKAEKGIRSICLSEKYAIKEDGFYWDIEVNNTSGHDIEIGEISLAFLTNTDYTGIFEDSKYENEENWRGIKQKLWHEQKVQQHLCVNGSSSYVFLQRPKGDYPAVLFQVLKDTYLEEAYQMDKHIGNQWSLTFEGPYYLALYSNAARRCGEWKYETEQQSYGPNGNTSLFLKKGEKKGFHFVFHVLYKQEDLKRYLYDEGQLAIEIQPSMVVPIDVPLKLCIRSKEVPTIIPVANNMIVECEEAEGDFYYYSFLFTKPGQKMVRIFHGQKKTTILFYALDCIDKLLENHAQFIVERQFYENPLDPYGRNHAFLPYDDAMEMIFTESEESWQVGALDEYALPVAMYVAEKNTIIPNRQQIDTLEKFIDDCLYGVLQQKDTYYARRGMYYEERTPSDIFMGNKWDKEKAESILRSFNYPLITDIYLAMYKIASNFGLTKIRDKEMYLEMAYKTAMTGYELGRNKFNGAPAGASITELLAILEEDNKEWYSELNEKVRKIAIENSESEYPYGSELYVDQTPHNQCEAMLNYYDKKEKLEEVYRVTKALRNGGQPEWYLYGVEKRGNVCCWYGTPLNTRVLFRGFDSNEDLELLKLGYGGLLSFLTCIRSNGAAHGWYLFWPDRRGFDFRSLDTDMGMYGYIRSAQSYVVDDPIFGRCGYGCSYAQKNGIEEMIPYDGLGIRFTSVPHNITLVCKIGQIRKVEVSEKMNLVRVYTQCPRGYSAKIDISAPEGYKVEIL